MATTFGQSYARLYARVYRLYARINAYNETCSKSGSRLIYRPAHGAFFSQDFLIDKTLQQTRGLIIREVAKRDHIGTPYLTVLAYKISHHLDLLDRRESGLTDRFGFQAKLAVYRGTQRISPPRVALRLCQASLHQPFGHRTCARDIALHEGRKGRHIQPLLFAEAGQHE